MQINKQQLELQTQFRHIKKETMEALFNSLYFQANN